MFTLALLVLLAACDEAEPSSSFCRADPTPSTAPVTASLRVGGYGTGGDLADWAEGETVPLVFGFQGGYMLQPVVTVEGEDLDCGTVRLRATVAGEVVAEGAAAVVFFPNETGPLESVSVPVDVLLGFELDALVGNEATFELSVETPDWRSMPATATVMLANPG
ncbi:MAG: hypothetical protein AAGH15_03500 [Myxococcota bacterium]